MNAPLIFIGVPGFIAGFLYIIRRKRRLVNWVGSCTALFLALTAWKLPVGSEIRAGPFPWLPPLFIDESFTVFGRQFILADPYRSTLIIIYLGTTIWFIGSTVSNTTRLFIPLGLGIASLLTATISVEPFLYSALFIEIAVLLCIPLLSPPGQPVSNGALRFMTFQTIGILILLFFGSVLGSADLLQFDPAFLSRLTVLLGLGFVIVMGVFPFSIWIPMVAQEAHPFSAAFIFYTFPQILILFSLNFFAQSNWFQITPIFLEALSFLGSIMIIGAGLWSVFQKHLGRIFGFAVITEIGLSLIGLSRIVNDIGQREVVNITAIAGSTALSVFLLQLLPFGLNLAIWALALSIIFNITHGLDFETVTGLARQTPVASISIAIAQLSIAGFPLLAGYNIRTLMGTDLVGKWPILALAVLIGFGGLMMSAIRSQVVLFANRPEGPWQFAENRLQLGLLIGGCVLLVGLGILGPIYMSQVAGLFPVTLPSGP